MGDDSLAGFLALASSSSTLGFFSSSLEANRVFSFRMIEMSGVAGFKFFQPNRLNLNFEKSCGDKKAKKGFSTFRS
jgi:hypothetical protein